MDLQPEELQFLTIPQLLQESISIKKRSPRTFYLITLSLIFPLSFAILAHSLFTQPLLAKLDSSDPPNSDRSRHDWTKLLIFQFSYLIFLFAFSLLSTAAVVFTVASLYTGKPVSFSSTISAIPKVFKRLLITFLWVALLMFAYNAVFFVFLVILFVALDMNSVGLAVIAGLLIAVLYFGVHVYFTALWHLGSVISVLEPVYGLAAMRKAYELLKGKVKMAMLNRGLGTLIAGSLAFFIEFVANDSGKVLRAIFIGTAVFIIGAAATYIRFIPYIKKNYDYGVVIFLLTFNLITVSSYRVDSVINIAHDRLYTIAIGCGICLFMSLLVFPIWSGEDLHKTTVGKLQGLSRSIEACVSEYFEEKEKETSDSKDKIYEGYQAVLDSKSIDETLALYANWEPRHTRRCHRFPCQQYVKVGAVLRQFGYTVVALHGCLQTEIQTPRSVRALFKDPCVRLAGEVCKALSELADSISNHRHCSPEILSDHLHVALQDLNSAIKSQPKLFLGSNLHRQNNKHQNAVSQRNRESNVSSKPTEQGSRQGQSGAVSLSSFRTDTSALMEYRRSFKNNNRSETTSAAAGERRMLRPQLSKIAVMTSLEFSEALPFAAFASLLVEMVARLDNVIEEVEELGRIACFKEYDNARDPTADDVRCEKPANVVISVGAAE